MYTGNDGLTEMLPIFDLISSRFVWLTAADVRCFRDDILDISLNPAVAACLLHDSCLM